MGLRNPGAERDLRPEREPRTVRYIGDEAFGGAARSIPEILKRMGCWQRDLEVREWDPRQGPAVGGDLSELTSSCSSYILTTYRRPRKAVFESGAWPLLPS